jgi:glycosyltransferase involved in cell wall biosynthesis
MIPQSDGNINRGSGEKGEDNGFDWNKVAYYIEYSKSKKKNFVLGVLAQVKEDPDIKYMYLPLDDTIFQFGIRAFFNKDSLPAWETRSSDLCWVGRCSGEGEVESLRYRFVDTLFRHPSSSSDSLPLFPNKDKVRLSYWSSENKNFPSNYFSDRVDYTEFLKYKICFIVDGNVIASNHMWAFASGGVPVMMSNAKCWFLEYLIPNVHYVPVKYDLSDLVEKIVWIQEHEDEARQIAQNAYEFATTTFSSDFQQNYLLEQFRK